jgi:hypothetical protein
MDEFLAIHEWYIGWKNEEGNPVFDDGSFVEIEYKYFEGVNIPIRRMNGELEPFSEAYDRVKRWFAIPMDERTRARANFC